METNKNFASAPAEAPGELIQKKPKAKTVRKTAAEILKEDIKNPPVQKEINLSEISELTPQQLKEARPYKDWEREMQLKLQEPAAKPNSKARTSATSAKGTKEKQDPGRGKKMSNREWLRAEEDYFESLGLNICDGCKKNSPCSLCRYHYKSMYEPSGVIMRIREDNMR